MILIIGEVVVHSVVYMVQYTPINALMWIHNIPIMVSQTVDA